MMNLTTDEIKRYLHKQKMSTALIKQLENMLAAPFASSSESISDSEAKKNLPLKQNRNLLQIQKQK